MAENLFEGVRLTLMQDALPVGIAIAERVRTKGLMNTMELFSSSEEPLNDLRVEGEPLAKSLREQLDQVNPGLGNPVMSVKVAVDEGVPSNSESEEIDTLIEVLTNIDERLDLLDNYFNNQSDNL
tara:strand:+ start:865 stop:1239 length:375 start_codon:yes stop_codon:yes gene_type:complete